ncbi:MAG: hypothetical protein KJZ77_18465 [Anaerolineales bacterium]|nr:hypothetical protein [Anaerolineales bacterium]
MSTETSIVGFGGGAEGGGGDLQLPRKHPPQHGLAQLLHRIQLGLVHPLQTGRFRRQPVETSDDGAALNPSPNPT